MEFSIGKFLYFFVVVLGEEREGRAMVKYKRI